MQVINMGELNYDLIDYLEFSFLPCELDMLIRGMETYMYIFHNVYSQHDDSDEAWTRDYIAMNLYNKLVSKQSTQTRTKYDVMENCRKHANAVKRRQFDHVKKFYKKIA